MSEAVPAQQWRAAGIRQELLMRVLPALRHDMAGPLSVARMGNTVLKRYLEASPFNAAQCEKRLAQTDEQLNQLLAAVRALGRWDTESAERVEAVGVVRAGLHLARAMLDLHGLQLEVPDALPAAVATWPPLQPAQVLYGVTGALSYLQDAAEAPATIHIAPHEDGFALGAAANGAAFPATELRPVPRRLRVDADALRCLAADLRWPMEVDAGKVSLGRPADMAAAPQR